MTEFDHFQALVQGSSLDLLRTTIVCEGLEMPLAKLVDTFQGYFLDNALEFDRLVQDLLHKGAFEFDPINGVRVVVKVVNWGGEGR